MSASTEIARKIATALAGCIWRAEDLIERSQQFLGKRARRLEPLVRRIAAAYVGRPRPRIAALARFIDQDPGFQRIWTRQKQTGDAIEFSVGPLRRPVMSPCVGPPASWLLPDLPTPGSLAEWLDLTTGELDWFADCHGRERRLPPGPLQHYRYRWVVKRSGGVRLIETPKSRLKTIQRLLLREILDNIPPHDAAHGFRRGRSVKTYVVPHVARRIVLRIDLRDFFTSIRQSRIVGVFLTAGYPEPVASLLTGLCTNSVPADVWEDLRGPSRPNLSDRDRGLQCAHLPQGSPTSPALANLCAYRLDCRLLGLAAAAGADYTRYADDLAFSGGDKFARSAKRFHVHVAAIAMEEGFRVNYRKTRIMQRSVRQHLAGVVVNEKPSIRRRDFDELKAILYNCARYAPQSQNRRELSDFRAHLLGRIEHVRMLHSERGARLRELFDAIKW